MFLPALVGSHKLGGDKPIPYEWYWKSGYESDRIKGLVKVARERADDYQKQSSIKN